MQDDLKRFCQTHHAECLAQLAACECGRRALLQDPNVVPAIEDMVEHAFSSEARGFAEAALLALSDKKLQVFAEGQKHIMLSYQWNDQECVQRINDWLITHGYVTWFDLTNMKGKWLLWACRSIVVLLSARNVCVHLI